MNVFKLSWAYLLHRKLNSLLSLCLVAFGAFLITSLFLLSQQIKNAIEQNINNVDMVIGAKGSPMQIILSAIFHIDFPTGNISLEEAEYFSRHPLVKEAVAISLGDSYSGFRIMGVGNNYFDFYELQVDEGVLPLKPMEVVLGSAVAIKLDLEIGKEFTSSHGFDDGESHESRYRVTGILMATHTPIDNLILTQLESYWETHHTDEQNKTVTNLLMRYKNPMAAVRLPGLINATGNLQAAVPSFEAARLFAMAGIGVKFVSGLALVFIAFAAFSIFISMYAALNEKKYDLAIMRSLGASGTKLFLVSLLEGIIISAAGGATGIAFSHLVIEILLHISGQTDTLLISGATFYHQEIFIMLLSIFSGMLGAIVPSIMAYRTEISTVFSAGR